MGTNTILRNVLLLEGKDYTPEQIDGILNNRVQAINYATNIADRPSYAAALDLRSRAILTEAGKIGALSRKDVVDALQDDTLLASILVKRAVGDTIEYNGNKYQVEDILTIVPPALREVYGSDYECAKQFVAEYY